MLTARDAVVTTPRVALASERTRLACRLSPNRLSRKRCTCSKPTDWVGVMLWPCESTSPQERIASRTGVATSRAITTGDESYDARHDSFQKAQPPNPVIVLPNTPRDKMRGWLSIAVSPGLNALSIKAIGCLTRVPSF